MLNQIPALKMKINGRLKLSDGEEITANVFLVFSKQIFEYINKIKIYICRWNLIVWPSKWQCTKNWRSWIPP